MIYNSFYGLTFNPFDKQQLKEKDCFQSRDFKEMNLRLNHLKNIRGIGVFTALPGMGKSYALRCFAKGLNPNQYHMEYMCLSTISVADFYKQFCSILGVSDKGGKPAMFKAIQEQITYLYRDKHQPLLLAIDEAQYLSNGILNDIKMLMNYGYDSLNCAGASCSIINDAALGAIHGYSRGNPRLIDNLMTDSLAIGAQQERRVIDDEIILAAVNNQNF